MASAAKLVESYSEVSKDVVHLGTHIVRPLHFQLPARLPLTNIDLAYTKPEYSVLAFLFRRYTTDSTYQKLLDSLRASLSKTLVHYPVLAGRLVGDGPSGRLEVDMNAKGIHFVEATSDASFQDWEDIRHCPVDVDLCLNRELSDPTEDPILKIQVTKFRCGGIAISVHFMHQVLDGYSLLNFLNSWSQVHRRVPIETLPSFMRDNVLVPRSPPRLDAPVPLMIEGLDQDVDASFMELEEVKQPLNLITLRMEPSAVQACVSEVESGAFSYGKATSFEAISSLLWSSMVRARGLPQHLDTAFLFPMNVRGISKLGLSVPETYFGNAVATSQVRARRVGDILSNDKSFAASLIRKAKLGCDRKSVQSMVDWLEMNPGSINKLLHWRRGVMFTTLRNFPVYDLNFGKGCLEQACFLPGVVAPHMSFAATLPSPPGRRRGSMDVVVGLREEQRDELLNDEKFTRYFSVKEIKMWTSSYIRGALRRIK